MPELGHGDGLSRRLSGTVSGVSRGCRHVTTLGSYPRATNREARALVADAEHAATIRDWPSAFLAYVAAGDLCTS